jgi:2-C-methyl-D-erythritol 4-phosphate cytidylyltransferase
LLLHSVREFQNCDAIREIVIVTREDLLMEVMSLCAGFSKVRGVVVGGADRPASVQAGLNNLSDKVKLVAVHDGARPLITWQVIDRTVRAAHSYGAAAPAIPVKDTIKVVKGGIVGSTPDRNTLQAVQTPQVFDLQLLKGALIKAQKDKTPITDDCSAVEQLGKMVYLVEGDEANLKITTPIDLVLAGALLRVREERA